MTLVDLSVSAVDRKTLRARLIAARMEMDDRLYRQSCAAITAALLAHLSSFGAKTLGFYWPHRREYDAMPVARKIIDGGGHVALPAVVDKGKPLEFRPWHPDIHMMIGMYEIPHPEGGSEVVPDLILLPTVGFDEAGYRLGYGGGYYDRTLAHNTPMPVTIGIGFEFSRMDSIDPQPHDIPLDFMVTEKGVFQNMDGTLRPLT